MWRWAPPGLTCHLSEDKQRVTWPGSARRDWPAGLFSMQVRLRGRRSPCTHHVCSITMNYWSEGWSIWIGCILSRGQTEEEGCGMCVWLHARVCVCKKGKRSESCVFLCLQGFFFFCFSFLLHIFFLPSLPEIGEGGREVGGVTTDVLPPSESCLFDGDSGAYHVAWGANSKYYNTTRCSLQTPFLALCQSISPFLPLWCCSVDGTRRESLCVHSCVCVCVHTVSILCI